MLLIHWRRIFHKSLSPFGEISQSSVPQMVSRGQDPAHIPPVFHPFTVCFGLDRRWKVIWEPVELSNKAQILTFFLLLLFLFCFLPQSFQEDQWKRRSKSELIVLFSVSSRCSDVLTFSSVSQLTLYLGKRDYVDDISKVEQVGKFPTVGLVQSSYHSGRPHLEPNLVSDQFPIKSEIIRPQSRSEVIIVNGVWVNKTLHHSFRVCF